MWCVWNCKELDQARAGCGVFKAGSASIQTELDVVDCKELIQCEYSNCTELDVVTAKSWIHCEQSWMWWVWILDQARVCLNCRAWSGRAGCGVFETAKSWIRRVLNCTEMDLLNMKNYTLAKSCFAKSLKKYRGRLRGTVSEFELQSQFYVHFRKGKVCFPFALPPTKVSIGLK